MTKQTEALRMAIAEIEGWIDHAYGHTPEECADNKTIQACKEALEQPTTQEPVATVSVHTDMVSINANPKQLATLLKMNGTQLYTHPKEWQGLSDDELEELSSEEELMFWGFARAIEAKLKEKNNV